MEKKYILTDEARLIDTHTVHRIQAVRDFVDVKAGDLGGWVESEANLAQDGYCWVYNDAAVFQDAKVFGYGHVRGHALVFGHAEVYGAATVNENSAVRGQARIYEFACVYGQAQIFDDARIHGWSRIKGDAVIFDHANIYGRAEITGETCLRDDANISSNSDFLVIGPIGSRYGYTTFARSSTGDILVSCGCFSGTLEEFEDQIRKTHGNNEYAKSYQVFTNAVKTHFDI